MKKFLVIGDIILDEYYYVNSNRKSQEAPIPVWDIVKTEVMLGGAANVAANIRSLEPSAVVHLAGISNYQFLNYADKFEINFDAVSLGEPITKKRFVSIDKNEILFRADKLKKFLEKDIIEFNSYLFSLLRNNYDFIIFSDYDKGTLSESTIKKIMNMQGVKIVDSKRIDLLPYSGSDILKINFGEYSEQVSCGLYPQSVESLFESVVVTHGKDGADIFQLDKALTKFNAYTVHSERIKTRKANVVDVTGCGDVHTAAISVSLSRGLDLRDAVKFANYCATASSEVFGTTKL